jgi:hypothetical protein
MQWLVRGGVANAPVKLNSSSDSAELPVLIVAGCGHGVAASTAQGCTEVDSSSSAQGFRIGVCHLLRGAAAAGRAQLLRGGGRAGPSSPS